MATKTAITIAANAINAKLHEPTVEQKIIVQTALSYKVEGAEHSLAFKQHRWDGRSSFFNYKTASFPAGFLHFVSAHLRSAGYEVRIAKKPLPEPRGSVNPKVDSFPEDLRYDYQPQVVERLLKHGQIIAQIATGGGKSRVCKLAHARINRPTLFLTTRSILMYQMKDSFEKDMGVKCSVIGDGQFGLTDTSGRTSIKMMTVGMVQTLVSKLEETDLEIEFQKLYNSAQKKFEQEIKSQTKELQNSKVPISIVKQRIAKLIKAQESAMTKLAPEMTKRAQAKLKEKTIEREKTIKLLEMFEFVVLEEAHEAGGNSYYEILRHCKNAHYRLALTGTPFMKDDEEANMRLMASSGPVAIKVSEKMLIDRGILAKPYFKTVQLKKQPLKLLRGTSWQSAYRLGITENEERNLAVVEHVKQAVKYGMTAMVLVQHTAHGEHLARLFADAKIKAKFIRGENDQEERKDALSDLAKSKINVLIGTTILDVGVDVPAVGMIILAGGGKAEVALRQRIGRGLRAKKAGPNVAFVVDFSDHWNNYTKAHAQQRLSIIKNTEGFGENIVKEFEFEKLGFKEAV